MTALTVREFDFHGDTLLTAMHEGRPVVALKRVVEALGLSWPRQLARVTTDPKFANNCAHMCTVAEDGKPREMVVLPVDKLHGWLFTINPNKVRADLREKLDRYQNECFAALHAYWTQGVAVRDADGLDEASRRQIGGIVKSVLHKEIVNLLPALVAAELERDPRHVAVSYVPALQVLIDHKVPPKGRGHLSRRVSTRLRRFCGDRGFMVRLSREPTRYLYPPEAVLAWLAHEGAALIRDHIAKLNGQGVLKLVPRS